MKLAAKAAKVFTGDAWVSAKRHLRQWRLRGASYRFDAVRFSRSIDRDAFARIHRKYAIPEPGVAPPKYLDLVDWMHTNVRRVGDLGLDRARPERILDLG